MQPPGKRRYQRAQINALAILGSTCVYPSRSDKLPLNPEHILPANRALTEADGYPSPKFAHRKGINL